MTVVLGFEQFVAGRREYVLDDHLVSAELIDSLSAKDFERTRYVSAFGCVAVSLDRTAYKSRDHNQFKSFEKTRQISASKLFKTLHFVLDGVLYHRGQQPYVVDEFLWAISDRIAFSSRKAFLDLYVKA